MTRRWHVPLVLCSLVVATFVACQKDGGKQSPADSGSPVEDAGGVADGGTEDGGTDAGIVCDGGVFNPDAGACVEDPPVDPTPVAEFEDKFLTSWCNHLIRCNAAVQDKRACRREWDTRENEFNSLGISLKLQQDGKTTYDGKSATRCLDALDQLACGVPLKSQLALPACQTVFTGTLADQSPCIADGECRTGSFCLQAKNGSSPACAGSCQKRAVRCELDSDCAAGLVCSGQQYCVVPEIPPGEENEPCGSHDLCSQATRPLGCFYDAQSNTNVCKPLGRQGFACDIHRRCSDGYICLDAIESGQLNSTCFRPPSPEEGEACNGTDPYACGGELVCVFESSDLQSGVCRRTKVSGTECNELFECSGFFGSTICDLSQHACVTRPSAGDCPTTAEPGVAYACDFAVSYCDTQTQRCTALKAAGDKCQKDYECGPWYAEPKCQFNQAKGYSVCSTKTAVCK